MALAKRPIGYPSGFDKKHDLPVHSQSWRPVSKMPTGLFSFRKRRLVLAVVVALIVYLFIHYLPTDLPSAGQRIDLRTGLSQGRMPSPPTGKKDTGTVLDSRQLYDGPVQFYRLASTLHTHSYDRKSGRDNVAFLLRDFKSASSLIGVACDFALFNRSSIHVAVLSTYDNPIEEIVRVNGIKQSECPIIWHDARPDYNSQSSKARQSTVVKSALGHLHVNLRPTAFIIDQQQSKDEVFKGALDEKLASFWMSPVIIPDDTSTSMSWVISLDGKALSLLNQVQIDVIITPYKDSAGSLVRLLSSIQNARYEGLPLPHITVELPHDIDGFALDYLKNFRWSDNRGIGESKLVLRRRLDVGQLIPDLASLRTIESFYPPSSPLSHALVLSPDVELSPNYMHYLMYLTLDYKYGRSGQNITDSLMGISLDLPKTTTNADAPFLTIIGSEKLFLHQTPSSTAALYFGDKWVELQDYLSLRLQHDRTLSKSLKDAPHVSDDHPSWLAQASEIMQARNYFMLYPGFATDATSRLATVHTELHQAPEEYATKYMAQKPKHDDLPIPSMNDRTVLTADEELTSQDRDHAHARLDHEQQSGSRPITALLGLGDRETLPPGNELPLYLADGHRVEPVDAEVAATRLADSVSLEFGGCDSLEDRDESKIGSIEYLFCRNEGL